jgi:nucleotide-binding universal stress UspA family protein
LVVEEVRRFALEYDGVKAILLPSDVGEKASERTTERAADEGDMAWVELDAVDLLQ